MTRTELSDALEMVVTLALPKGRTSDTLTLDDIALVEAAVRQIFADCRAAHVDG